VERCTADPDAIPWLLLEAVDPEGPGIFQSVTFIQRKYEKLKPLNGLSESCT